MSDFLTLGISEKRPTVPDEFVVVAMDMRTKDITRFDVDKSDIVSSNGEIFWDIGFTTNVSEIIYPNRYNIVPKGARLGENRIKDLKKILESKSSNPSAFFNSKHLDYSIVKVMNVEEIIKNNENSKFYITVNIEGLRENPQIILNKDYRWVKYWKYICKTGDFNYKKKQYTNVLNNKSKSLYLILYRYDKNNRPHWIVGMHLL